MIDMERSNIAAFNSRVAEAGSILEAANATEIARAEMILSTLKQMKTQIQIRHSETMIFIKECWTEQERATNETHTGMLRFLDGMSEDYTRRLAELRETPAPKLIGGETHE